MFYSPGGTSQPSFVTTKEAQTKKNHGPRHCYDFDTRKGMVVRGSSSNANNWLPWAGHFRMLIARRYRTRCSTAICGAFAGSFLWRANQNENRPARCGLRSGATGQFEYGIRRNCAPPLSAPIAYRCRRGPACFLLTSLDRSDRTCPI